MASWLYVNSNTSVISDANYLVDTSTREIYLTLPESPAVGDQIVIADATLNQSNNVIVSGGLIEGSGNPITINQKNYQISFVYNGSFWKRYNLAVPQVRISELDEIVTQNVSNNDVLAIVDSENFTTNKIKFSTIKTNITGGLYSNTSLSTLVGDLNSYTTANTSPLLNVKLFNGSDASFYRNYNNLTNKPVIPTRTSQLINDGSSANTGSYITGLTNFSTDQLSEGSTNLYFTNTRFDERLDSRFPELFRLYSNEFEESEVLDSPIDIPATPVTTVTATNTLNINPSDISKFAAGQRIRIFGANEEDTPIVTTPTITNVIKGGLTGTNGNFITYRLAQFDITTGKISPATTSSTTIFIGTNTLDSFNNTNNIEIVFNRSSGNYGVLVYRSYNGGLHKLIDVLGPKELGLAITTDIRYKDFANFNNNPWTRKNANGEYDDSTGIVHMPLISPSSSSKGWVDATIASINTSQSRIVLTASYYFAASAKIFKNDTVAIQEAVNARIAAGVNSLILNDRRYVISSVVLPPTGQFTLSGKGRQTVLYKLPWSTESHNRIVYTSGTIAENVALTNLDIDGNMQNQWLKYDDGNVSDANYAISFQGSRISLDKVFVDNIIGGGLYSFQPSTLSVNLSRFENSGMSDFFAFSPLYAPEGDDLIITNNVFRNFSDAIDLNTSDNGIFSGNFVENTGSGVLVFGSRFFISSPNIIKGPAGEFIPTPDVLNSEYDSVNITLEANTTYTSISHTYQENGQVFDLTANEGSLAYKIDKLGKFDNQEVLYGQLPDLISDEIGPDKTQGEFQFSIPKVNVETLMTTYSYPTLKAANTAHIGLVYRAIQTEIVPSGTVAGSGTINPDGLGNDKYRVTLINYSNLSVGRTVKFADHGGEIGSGTLNNTEGVILSVTENIAPTVPEAYVIIDYPVSVTSVGTGGSLKIKNEFVLVKGRIQ